MLYGLHSLSAQAQCCKGQLWKAYILWEVSMTQMAIQDVPLPGLEGQGWKAA